MLQFLQIWAYILALTFGQNTARIPGIGGASAGGGSSSVYTFIQSCTHTSGGGVTSDSCTFGSPLGAGHLLYGSLMDLSNGNLAGCTWTGDTGTQAVDLPEVNFSAPSPQWRTLGAFYILSTTGGGSTITCTSSTSGGLNFSRMTLIEASATATPRHDVSGASPPNISNGGSGNPLSFAVTTTTNGEFLIGITALTALDTITAGSGFTAPIITNISSLEYKTQTTGGSGTTVNFGTAGGSDAWATHIAAFK